MSSGKNYPSLLILLCLWTHINYCRHERGKCMENVFRMHPSFTWVSLKLMSPCPTLRPPMTMIISRWWCWWWKQWHEEVGIFRVIILCSDSVWALYSYFLLTLVTSLCSCQERRYVYSFSICGLVPDVVSLLVVVWKTIFLCHRLCLLLMRHEDE